MRSKSLIYEAVVREVKQEVYVEGLVYGIVDDSTGDGERMTTHRLRKAWVDSDGVGAIDSKGNEFLVIDFDKAHPSVMDSMHALFALAYQSSISLILVGTLSTSMSIAVGSTASTFRSIRI